MSRLQKLKQMESKLENFLSGVAEFHQDDLNRVGSLDALEDIVTDSLRGRYVNNRLKYWFDLNQPLIEDKRFESDELTQIANYLEDIKKGLDPEDMVSQKLIDDIGMLREKGVVPKRKIILKLKRKPEGSELLDKFVKTINTEMELLQSGQFGDDHLLSILDDILKSADAKIDSMYLHLAGSIIFYLKINGYKVTPFVKRLKELEDKKLKSE